MNSAGKSSDPPDDFAPVLDRNIAELVRRRREKVQASSMEERVAAAITRFSGSMRFVYLHIVLFGGWLVVNLGWLPVRPFDPSFVILAMVASVEAIFLSTFVLITQNRLAAEADRRAELDLQISLLAEHEITAVLTVVSAMAKKLEVAEASGPGIDALKRDVAPGEVLDRIDAAEDQAEKSG